MALNGPIPSSSADAPEIRMVAAHHELEYNIGNGGWSQVLWSCFGYWRQLINAAHEGYMLIEATAQAEALSRLSFLCQRDEAECEAYMTRAHNDEGFSCFGEFTRRSYLVRDETWQELFYLSSGIHEVRLAWLQEHEGQVLALLNA